MLRVNKEKLEQRVQLEILEFKGQMVLLGMQVNRVYKELMVLKDHKVIKEHKVFRVFRVMMVHLDLKAYLVSKEKRVKLDLQVQLVYLGQKDLKEPREILELKEKKDSQGQSDHLVEMVALAAQEMLAQLDRKAINHMN